MKSRRFQNPCLAVLLVLFCGAGCSGDSDPVGQSVPQQWSWPFQLADSLSAFGDTLRNLDIVAQTGWTTRDLLNAFRDSLDVGGTVRSGPDRQGNPDSQRDSGKKIVERGIVMIDITTVSRLAAAEPELVARDGLHYSGEMYRRWVALMMPSVRFCLGLPD